MSIVHAKVVHPLNSKAKMYSCRNENLNIEFKHKINSNDKLFVFKYRMEQQKKLLNNFQIYFDSIYYIISHYTLLHSTIHTTIHTKKVK